MFAQKLRAVYERSRRCKTCIDRRTSDVYLAGHATEQICCCAQGDVPQLPSILPKEPSRPSSTPVAAFTKASDSVPNLPNILPKEPSRPSSTPVAAFTKASDSVPNLPNILPKQPARPSSTPVAAFTEAADAVPQMPNILPKEPPRPSSTPVAAVAEAANTVPNLPNILPGEPARPSSTPVATLNEAADALQSTSAVASPGRSPSNLNEPAASSTASAARQQAALQRGAGTVTSQRGQGWLRAMWNRSAITGFVCVSSLLFLHSEPTAWKYCRTGLSWCVLHRSCRTSGLSPCFGHVCCKEALIYLLS